MRGVSLAAAFALPLTTEAGDPFSGRDLILFLTLVVIVASLVLQGFTLPYAVRLLGLRTDSTQSWLKEAAAQQTASTVALNRLEQLLSESDGVPAGVVERLREKAEARQLGAWERLGGGSGGTMGSETPSAAYRRLRREMLLAERAEFLRLRDAGEIGDDVLRRVQRELDLEEALLSRD